MTIGARVTIAAIAVTAFALCDLVHEVIGHGLAVLLVPGGSAISLSSVALQTTGESRFVAAAGSLANIVIGSAALVRFHRQRRFAAMAGLTAIPRLVDHRVGRREATGAVSFEPRGVVTGFVVAIVFTTVIGRGIQF